MKLLSPTQHKRLNELTGLLMLSVGLVVLLSLVSYHAQDPSLNTAADSRPLNLIGYPGAYLSDLALQTVGAAAFLFPLLIFTLAWRWVRSEAIEAGAIKLAGACLLLLSVCTALSFLPIAPYGGNIRIGGTLGLLLCDSLRNALNLAGSLVAVFMMLVVSLYLVSKFTVSKVGEWLAPPVAYCQSRAGAWRAWRERARLRAEQKARIRTLARMAKFEQQQERKARRLAVKEQAQPVEDEAAGQQQLSVTFSAEPAPAPAAPAATFNDEPAPAAFTRERAATDAPPWDSTSPGLSATAVEPPAVREIPIVPVETASLNRGEEPASWAAAPAPRSAKAEVVLHPVYRLPPTSLLNESPPRNPYDEQELKDTASAIKAKFEEFSVMGNVVQINPGPVVTTYEFKPDAGVKYSRITNLTEDLCLGLQAESILIERIPGKPTVGIEVPNTRREVISLRQMLESDDFQTSGSKLTIPLGKDINGRIRMAALDAMPHLLIAGSTGSGKSVMINSMVMSILYKSTPDEVRMIMVDPKRLELGLYEGVPHLLTPVITDPKKATNALRNAVLEMERRLGLLAEFGVRNIEQFNKKVRKLQETPRDLFAEGEDEREEVKPLPYILILIDELADLMMLEGRNVEESVMRLAQMARAVGMHLVLATQRPSVDVITGVIKANFPARISFRVATRVDSRTILDSMGAEHLLGKGDMLFLPPGSSRLTRVHGAFVTESEIALVVDHWKAQATPEYDQSFLLAPPNEDGETADGAASEEQDPMYEDAVKLVLQMGKASTSTLQRHLRLGYGRAARILDMMQRDGVIGPPDGSKPREVLKPPAWLREVEREE